jgi:hypothetical protein
MLIFPIFELAVAFIGEYRKNKRETRQFHFNHSFPLQVRPSETGKGLPPPPARCTSLSGITIISLTIGKTLLLRRCPNRALCI